MVSVICTLFEGPYHYGVAVLTNSLYKNGFRGDIYAGYKGPLPEWAKNAIPVEGNVDKVSILKVADGVNIYFVPLTTNYHLTNYKPDFMLSLLNGMAKHADAIFYYDPDIVQAAPWQFMEEWVSSGVAVSEDVNSPLEKQNPKRVYWRNYFGKFGQTLTFKSNIYVNGGFAAVMRRDVAFLEHWQKIQENMALEIGGLEIAIFNKGKKIPVGTMNNFYAFGKTDQDALNATIEFYPGEVSYQRKEAMNFGPGLTIMPHAIGRQKPWNKKFFSTWLKKGHKPSLVDKLFWENGLQPIAVHSSSQSKAKLRQISMVNFLSRFYRT